MGKDNWIKGIILGLLVAIGGWALFQLALKLVQNGLAAIGLTNELWGNVAIVLFVIVALFVGWHTGLKGAVKKLVK